MTDKVSKKINFQFANNLIIIPLEINGVTLSFVLDTGVNKAILFNLTERDSLDLKEVKTFYLHGLGADGRLKALKSSHNKFKIGSAVGTNQDLYVILDKSINFTPRLGVLVHGIIGYDIFKDFVVEINYSSKYIRLYNPKDFKIKSTKKWKTIPVDIHDKKPYLKAYVAIDDIEEPIKLLIDTGSSDALWLFEDKEIGLTPNKDLVFVDYLGKGLSGAIYGKRSKVKSFKLSEFNLNNVNVAFPDSVSINKAKVIKGRNGSLGGDVLKRFRLFFDYKNKRLHLKQNRFFKDPFTYNNSGLVLEHNGIVYVKEYIKSMSSDGDRTRKNMNTIQLDRSLNFKMSIMPAYEIVKVRTSSNAYMSGVREGDILISLNGKLAYDYKLSEINEIFHGKTGKTIKLNIERNGENIVFKFKLDNAFKKNELSN